MLKLIAVLTLVVCPILVLLLLQIQFLPFHDVTITWAQRGALFLDLVILWLLRPPILADLSIESAGRALTRPGAAVVRPRARRAHEHRGALVFHRCRDLSRRMAGNGARLARYDAIQTDRWGDETKLVFRITIFVRGRCDDITKAKQPVLEHSGPAGL